MRELYIKDYQDYITDGKTVVRPNVRGIILRDGKVAMVHSLKWDYYIFPGGGKDEGETDLQTLIREVAEETGLVVIPETVREFGMAMTKEKGNHSDLFIQQSYYYLCQVEAGKIARHLEDYEAEDEFVLEWADPAKVLKVNQAMLQKEEHERFIHHVVLRESYVLDRVMEECMNG